MDQKVAPNTDDNVDAEVKRASSYTPLVAPGQSIPKRNARSRRQSIQNLNSMSEKIASNVHNEVGTDEKLMARRKVRERPMARKINIILKKDFVKWMGLVNTIIALFLFDFNSAFLSKDWDSFTTAILLTSFVLFSLEIGLTLYAKKNYLCSFFMILDVLGTLSLIPDLLELSENIGAGQQTDLDVARAGRAGRLARTAQTLRFSRFARLFRVIRLFRVARVFRMVQSHQNQGLDDDDEVISTSTPSKLGIILSDTIAKRIIIMVITLIVVTPYLSYERPETKLAEMESILSLMEIYPTNDTRIEAANFVLNAHPETLFLQVLSYTGKDTLDENSNLRSTELIFADSLSGNSTATFSMKNEIVTEAVQHMLLLLFVVFIFGVGSFVISKDANTLVVMPIERMTHIIRKLAGTICILSTDDGKMDGTIDEMENETFMLESVVSKIAQLFDVRQDFSATDKNGKKKSKAERMLTGSKTTEIVAKGAVYRIDVVERAPAEVPSPVAAKSRVLSIQGDKVTKEASFKHYGSTRSISAADSALIEEHPELANMEAILSNQQASQYLKMFLAQHLQLENYMFWQEVEKFKTQMSSFADRVICHYITEGAISQVNIQASMRNKIEDAVTEKGDIHITSFDEAQAEIFKLLVQNNYSSFIESELCAAYVGAKEEDKLASSIDGVAETSA